MNKNPQTVAHYMDKYGEQREIHKNRGNRLSVKRQSSTVPAMLGPPAGKLLGERINAARLKAGLSLERLAFLAGLAGGKSAMWQIESKAAAQEGVRFGTLYALAWALKIEATELLPRNGEVLGLSGLVTRRVERLEGPAVVEGA